MPHWTAGCLARVSLMGITDRCAPTYESAASYKALIYGVPSTCLVGFAVSRAAFARSRLMRVMRMEASVVLHQRFRRISIGVRV